MSEFSPELYHYKSCNFDIIHVIVVRYPSLKAKMKRLINESSLVFSVFESNLIQILSESMANFKLKVKLHPGESS